MSLIPEMMHSRYQDDTKGDYGYVKCSKHANRGRLINALDVPAQIARGFISSAASAVLMPARITVGLAGVLVALPVTAAINGLQLLIKKDKKCSEIFEPTMQVAEFSMLNLQYIKSGTTSLLLDAGIRVGSIGADMIGIALPEVGRKMRLWDNELSDAQNEDRTEIFLTNSDYPIINYIFENVWPRADKIVWHYGASRTD